MDLIEKLGIEKCKQIVDGAPEGAESFNVHLVAYGSVGIPCKGDVLITDIRTAIANHERTDTCSDIKNHISPNTKVIDK